MTSEDRSRTVPSGVEACYLESHVVCPQIFYQGAVRADEFPRPSIF
jgi:hypothetical protein